MSVIRPPGDARLRLGVASIALLAAACDDDLQGPGRIIQTLPALIVSDPVVWPEVVGGGAYPGETSASWLAYISLPPASLPNGEQVVVRNPRNGNSRTASMLDGGFDPIALTASVGDTLELRIEVSGGGSQEYVAVVPASLAPVIVRTDPPAGAQEVPVDAPLLAVFSEPLEAATLNGASFQLAARGSPVAGTLHFNEINLQAAFTPGEPLDPGTDHELLITGEVGDRDGDAIGSQLRVAFKTAGSPPPPGIELVVDVTGKLAPPEPPPGSVPVAVGLFMSVSRIGSNDAVARAHELITGTNEILGQCSLHLVVESAQVIAVPPHLLSVQGNESGSWGGHPPEGVGDPDIFMYRENERLTSETLELFGYGKRYGSPNAISIFIVDEIEYYIGSERTGAAGLSFAPVIYHHADDYPLRNSVLALGTHGPLIAHELGHMLLDTGDHWGEGLNLMLGGTTLTPDQCERMHENRERLFGDDAVPDPGLPTTGATSIAIVSGDEQVGKAGALLELPFTVRVTDDEGQAVRHAYVTWSVASGAGRLAGGSSRTGADGTAAKWFSPTAVGISTVTAEVAETVPARVIFSVDAPVLVIVVYRPIDPWTGNPIGDPVFSGPEGGSDISVPVGTTVEWVISNVDSVHVASTSEPAGGLAFDSGPLPSGERFSFVPGVAGTWEFVDKLSGATGTLTAY